MKAQKYTRETIANIGVVDRQFPPFSIGDTVAVSLKVIDDRATADKKKKGAKEVDVKWRVQLFEGDVICIHNKGASSTFTVRKIGANSIPVERILPYQSPLIDSIQLVRHGKVRRAKLYYLRNRVGKAARVAERILTKEQKEQAVFMNKAAAAQKAAEAA